MNNGSSSISLSPLTSSEVRNNPYPAPLNSGRIGDFFVFYEICGVRETLGFGEESAGSSIPEG